MSGLLLKFIVKRRTISEIHCNDIYLQCNYGMDSRPTEMYQNTPCNDMRIIFEFFDPHVVFDF